MNDASSFTKGQFRSPVQNCVLVEGEMKECARWVYSLDLLSAGWATIQKFVVSKSFIWINNFNARMHCIASIETSTLFKKNLLKIKVVILHVLLIKESYTKKYLGFMQKILGNKTVININNKKKCDFLHFWFSCETEDWSSDAENSTFSLQKYVFFSILHFKIYLNRKYFWSNKYLLKNTFKNLPTSNFWMATYLNRWHIVTNAILFFI